MSNASTFLTMYADLMRGNVVKPRGQEIKECEDYMFVLDMADSPCTSFEARKFNLSYAKAEVVWYLGGDKFDKSIESKSTMWPKLAQPDGSYYSNYGQYIFGEDQYKWVIDELARDPDSRRASIVLLKSEHLFADNKDVVCTYGLNFRIRNGRLNMSVNMRSNDAVYGTTNDVFSFSILYKIVLAELKFGSYPKIQTGFYTHKVDSLHVYKRHWPMIEEIHFAGIEGYTAIEVPNVESINELIFLTSKPNRDSSPSPEYPLARWLWNE